MLKKKLACQANVPIVVGSWLNRMADYRDGIEGRRPQLADLPYSSAIEGLADVVIMVHRPEYYHIYEDDNGRDLHHLLQVIVRKNGLKPVGEIHFHYQSDTGVISSMETIPSRSSRASLDALCRNNAAVKRLVDTFNLNLY